jgi:hypothetical protein
MPITIDATRAKAVNTGVCHPGASASRLKAAPRLQARTRLKKPVTGSTGLRPKIAEH